MRIDELDRLERDRLRADRNRLREENARLTNSLERAIAEKHGAQADAERHKSTEDRLRAELQRIKDAVPMFPVPKDPVLYIQELLAELCPLKTHTRQMAEETEKSLGVRIVDHSDPREFAGRLMEKIDQIYAELELTEIEDTIADLNEPEANR